MADRDGVAPGRVARGAGLAAVVALGAVIAWRCATPDRAETPAPPAAAASAERRAPAARRPAAAPAAEPPPGAAAEAEEERPPADARELWERRLERAERTLETYLASARYPPDARPISERPDLQRAGQVSPRELPLAREDRAPTRARVTLEQDRYFVSGDEVIAFSVTCASGGEPAPCAVESAAVRTPAGDGAAGAPGAAAVAFEGDGRGGLAARFAPKTQGFAGYHGPLRLELSLRVADERGGASFDFLYTPDPPAKFTGAVREALEEGSLSLYVALDVARAGRYLLRARADDASGRPFAFLTFDGPLEPGRREARLRLFGKLVLDEGAESPFRLRDLEGFLLKENTHPDRETMPALTGAVFTTKRYATRDFSDAEWESEQKERYLRELTKDVEVARRRVNEE